tara:strand:- start:129309 stop:129746 length:438 start_codon:yes stop_codon:yes gene_type:complete
MSGAQETKKLNLQQKRYIQQHKENADFINYHTKISAIAGGTVNIEFDWATVEQGLLTDSFENMFLNNGNNIREWFLQNFEEGLKKVCTDQMSKDAFRDKIKKVKFIHDREGKLTLENDTLVFAANLHGNGCPGPDSVKSFLEENL